VTLAVSMAARRQLSRLLNAVRLNYASANFAVELCVAAAWLNFRSRLPYYRLAITVAAAADATYPSVA